MPGLTDTIIGLGKHPLTGERIWGYVTATTRYGNVVHATVRVIEPAKIHRPKIHVVSRAQRDTPWWDRHRLVHGAARDAAFLVVCPKCPDMCAHLFSMNAAQRLARRHVHNKIKESFNG